MYWPRPDFEQFLKCWCGSGRKYKQCCHPRSFT
ncbi:SEC-C metal-binding domain-containing protein [Nonomuraea sp. H19]